FFGLGVYTMGYSLNLQQAALRVARQSNLPPDFTPGPDMAMPACMSFGGLNHVPFWIAPLINVWLAIALAVLVPTLVAAIFGAVAFGRRIKGVYFSLITQ